MGHANLRSVYNSNCRLILDILSDPFQVSKEVQVCDSSFHLNLLRDPKFPEVALVAFYGRENVLRTMVRLRTVGDMVYDMGPSMIMDEAVQQMRSMLNRGGSDLGIKETGSYSQGFPKLTWVHLPSTNVSQAQLPASTRTNLYGEMVWMMVSRFVLHTKRNTQTSRKRKEVRTDQRNRIL